MYRVEQFTVSIYIIRIVRTNYTQCVLRIRLHSIVPQYQVDDLPQNNPDKFQRDPMLGRFVAEPAISDESIPMLLLPPSEEPCIVENELKPPTSVFYCSWTGNSTPNSFDENRETIPVFNGRGPRSYGRHSFQTPLTHASGIGELKVDKHTILLESYVNVIALDVANRQRFRLLQRHFVSKSSQEYLEYQRVVKTRVYSFEL